jgi:hypothetical protein
MTRAPRPLPTPFASIGHNGGPPLDDEQPSLFVRFAWAQAHRAVWKNPPMDILRFRVARAEAAGVSYREYMLELLDTGRHLQRGDVEKNRRRSPVGTLLTGPSGHQVAPTIRCLMI